jgi:hypothetical protein
MRALIAALLLSGSAWGAFAPGTVWYYTLDNTKADATGVYGDLTGSPPFVSSPTPPNGNTYAAGVFTGPSSLALPANALAALTNTGNSYTIDMKVYFNSQSGAPCVFGNGGSCFGQCSTVGLRWGSNGVPDILGPGSSVSTGAWHNLTFTYDGTKKTIYIDSVVYLGPSTLNGSATGLTSLNFGNYGGSLYLDGYVAQVRLLNYAAVPPIVDPGGASGNRGLRLWQILRPTLGWFDLLMPSKAYAIEQNGPVFSGQLKWLQDQSNQKKIKMTMTTTRTPTTAQLSFTATPTVTPKGPTPTVTPTK